MQRRGLLAGEMAVMCIVVHAIDRAERLPVQPLLGGDAIVIRRGARVQAGRGAGTVGRGKRVFGLGIETSLLHEATEAALAVQGRASM